MNPHMVFVSYRVCIHNLDSPAMVLEQQSAGIQHPNKSSGARGPHGPLAIAIMGF